MEREGGDNCDDPFEDSLSELRLIISSARSIVTNATTRGVVTADLVSALTSNIDEGESMLRSMQDVLHAMREGRLRGTLESAAPLPRGVTWLQREAAVVNASNELYDVSHAAKKLVDAFERHQRQGSRTVGKGPQSARGDAAVVVSDGGDAHGDYLRAHREEQEIMVASQDASLMRIHHGLATLKHNATEINTELGQQEELLEEAQSRMDLLKEKMAAANLKVDTLLNNMSDCKKICVIIVLCIVLGFLAVSVL